MPGEGWRTFPTDRDKKTGDRFNFMHGHLSRVSDLPRPSAVARSIPGPVGRLSTESRLPRPGAGRE